jgi:transposase
MRSRLRSRLDLTAKKVSCLNSIHRILEKFNLSLPGERRLSWPPNLELLKDLPVSAEYQFQLSFLSDQVRLLYQQIKDVEKWLQGVLTPTDDVRRLYTIPGVGKITAYSIYLELDGIERFESEKRFFSYCRLVPGAANSGNRHKHRSGSKDGNRYLKIAFSDAAVRAIQYYPEIREFYRKKARKTHRMIARTIVAKELARSAYFILKNKVEFETFKGVVLKKTKQNRWPRPASPKQYAGSIEAPLD